MIERYTRPEMGALWSQTAKYQAWLDVELAACRALARRGEIPPGDLAEIEGKAAFDIARIDEIEKEVKHDVIAFLTSVAEHVGPSSRFIHKGLTSSDVVDTGFALQLRRSGLLLEQGLERLDRALVRLAWKYRDARTGHLRPQGSRVAGGSPAQPAAPPACGRNRFCRNALRGRWDIRQYCSRY